MCNSTKYPYLPPIVGLKIQRGWPVLNAKYLVSKLEFLEARMADQTKTPSVWEGVEEFWTAQHEHMAKLIFLKKHVPDMDTSRKMENFLTVNQIVSYPVTVPTTAM